MPTNFTTNTEAPSADIVINEIPRDTSWTQVAETLKSINDSGLKDTLQERKDLKTYGDFSSSLASLEDEAEAELNRIAVDKATLESQIAGLSPEDTVRHREYMARLDALRQREEQTGRSMSAARNSLFREYVRLAPHLTEEFQKAGSAQFKFEEEARKYQQGFDDKDPYVMARDAALQESFKTGQPLNWVLENQRLAQEAQFLQHQEDIEKAHGKSAEPFVRRKVDLLIRAGMQEVERFARQLANNQINQATYYRNVTAVMEGTANSPGLRTMVSELFIQEGSGKQFSNELYAYAQSQLDGFRSIANGLGTNQSVAAQFAEWSAGEKWSGWQEAKRQYPSLAPWIAVAPEAATGYLTVQVPKFLQLLRQYPPYQLESAAAAGDTDAAAALDIARQNATARGLLYAEQGNQKGVEAANLLLRQLAMPDETVTIPDDPALWPWYGAAHATVVADPEAPPDVKKTPNFISNLVEMSAFALDQSVGLSKPRPIKGPDGKVMYEGGVLPRPWRGEQVRDYLRKNPAENLEYQTQYHAFVDKAIDDVFTWDLGALTGGISGWGKYAANVELVDGEFIILDKNQPGGMALRNTVAVLNSDADMMRTLGASEDEIAERQAIMFQRISDHRIEYEETMNTLRDLYAQTFGTVGEVSLFGAVRNLLERKAPIAQDVPVTSTPQYSSATDAIANFGADEPEE
jgi:hypothetical protein